MVLRNYYNFIATTNSLDYNSTITFNTYPVLKMSDGTVLSGIKNYDYQAILPFYWNAYLNLWVGSGDTPVTPNDYDLAVDETSNFSNINRTYLWDVNTAEGEEKVILTATFSGVNNTENPIIIREIGLSKPFKNSSGTDMPNKSDKTLSALFVRELVSQPQTINPQEDLNLTVTWEIK